MVNKEHSGSTGEGLNSLHPSHQARQDYRQQLECSEEYGFMVQTRTGGNIILQQVRLHPRYGSSTMIGSRIKVGIIGDLQPGLDSNILGRNHKHREICYKK